MLNEKTWPVYAAKVAQFSERLHRHLLSPRITLEAQMARTREPVPFARRLNLAYTPVAEGCVWGEAWDSAWFHLSGRVPAEWRGKQIAADLEFNGEAMIFGADGAPLQGLSNGSLYAPAEFKREAERTVFHLLDSCEGGEPVDLWIEASANSLFGVNRVEDPSRNCPMRHGSYQGRVNRIQLCVFNEALWRLRLDIEVLLNLMRDLPERSTRRARILRGLSEAVDRYADNPANAPAVRAHLRPLLDAPANASAVTALAIGHAHIDTAWLWPLRETVRKVARTFSSQLALLERYPSYVFGASQPQLYAFVKEHYPALYARIREAVKGGRWECQGAMWVEPDCNLISGESMVRQVLHGKNFFRDEFGVEVRNLWLPDVFGYSASMPQILRRAGVDYFLTQKMSWSQFNKFPHTTFRWRGIDGSEVLTHFPPEDSYISQLTPADLRKAEDQFREKDVLDEMMALYGFGDGGGGPKAETIESGLRQTNLEGVPRVKFGRADEFFDRLATRACLLPVWSGELYLELHRGTFTTQARTKRGNRKLELALREVEMLWSCLPLNSYPQAELDRLWKKLLTNQFHDIIPGSSIHLVYEEAERDHAEGLRRCRELSVEAGTRLFPSAEDHLVLVNTLSVPFTQALALPQGWRGATDERGLAIPAQIEADGVVAAAVAIPPLGAITLCKAGNAESAAARPDLILENDHVRYEFTPDARLIRAFDKQARRDILATGREGNVLTLYEDRPTNWDAWDIEIYYEDQALETARGTAHASLGAGTVRQGLRFQLHVGRSTIIQRVYLDHNTARLDFVTEVDWQEKHRMLRTAFPVNVRSDFATFEIQYGHVQRPTHRNTSWDVARFEVVAHRWADLSDGQYGVALLNDCKYGHRILDHLLDLNLLRSPTHPDPDADLGSHQFTYSLLPHTGSVNESCVPGEAAQLNQQPVLLEGRRLDAPLPLPAVSGEGVSLEVVKRAEKEDLRVIRIVETRGQRTQAVVALQPGERLEETDLMEWTALADLGAGRVVVDLEPFAIRTFKIME